MEVILEMKSSYITSTCTTCVNKEKDKEEKKDATV
jgi:hypothetical protein